MIDWIWAMVPIAVPLLVIEAFRLRMEAMRQRKNVSNLWKTLEAHGIKPGRELGPRMGKISFGEMWSGDME